MIIVKEKREVPASPYAASAGATLVATAAAPIRTVRANLRETGPSVVDRQTIKWLGLVEIWRVDGFEGGMDNSGLKDAVDAIVA